VICRNALLLWERGRREKIKLRGCPFGDYSGQPFPKTEENKWFFFSNASAEKRITAIEKGNKK
jgi:hypothetical protein